MRPGRPVDRGPGRHRVLDRGRRLGPQPQGQDSRRVPAAVQVQPGLGLLLRPRAGPDGAAAVHAPRQDDRRLVVDQRHAVRAGQQRGLRRLGQGRSRGLVLRRGPALLPRIGELLPRGRRLPRRRGTAQRHRPPQPHSDDPGHHRRSSPGGDPLQRGLQRRPPGRCRLPAGHPEGRQAVVRRRRLVAPRPLAQEPDCAHRPPGPGRRHRVRSGNWRLGVDRQGDRGRAGRTRGHPVRGQHRHPAAADALGDRSGRSPRRDGPRRDRGQPERRRRTCRTTRSTCSTSRPRPREPWPRPSTPSSCSTSSCAAGAC